ncbi:hypothetical protein GCM10009530_45790 [Microbispora corallina]|uniref:Uncharacterized protein n=1 Tax=Microbispora corallina TaxID=83302 RepID=A0ABQ4FWG8_9ACTN|nr:DUF6221 family protein [Microbispora corallina]GIH39162.1 hypothetical protein Mco01_21620 [Microbispora corallina]
MTDLITFLHARLDEEEQTARAAAAAAGGMRWHGSDTGLYNENHSAHPGPSLSDVYGYLDEALVAHLTRHDPARVLREVEAKRYVRDGTSLSALLARSLPRTARSPRIVNTSIS